VNHALQHPLLVCLFIFSNQLRHCDDLLYDAMHGGRSDIIECNVGCLEQCRLMHGAEKLLSEQRFVKKSVTLKQSYLFDVQSTVSTVGIKFLICGGYLPRWDEGNPRKTNCVLILCKKIDVKFSWKGILVSSRFCKVL